jgi:hypothetical protein
VHEQYVVYVCVCVRGTVYQVLQSVRFAYKYDIFKACKKPSKQVALKD